MKVGDCVANHYQGIIRYGKITKIYNNYKSDGWSWCDVDWFNDSTYTKSMQFREEITGKDYSLQKYRIDKLISFDLNKTIETLIKLQNSAE